MCPMVSWGQATTAEQPRGVGGVGWGGVGSVALGLVCSLGVLPVALAAQ
jgi:hypothetical protein